VLVVVCRGVEFGFERREQVDQFVCGSQTGVTGDRLVHAADELGVV
jgi:hypothetical protein